MITITNDYMIEQLATVRSYTVVTLKPGPNVNLPGRREIVWEHGRRNFELRAAGVMPIVCPVTADADINGFCIINGEADEAKAIMDADPAVAAGIFVYQLYPIKSFPGDRLPG